LAIEDSPAFLAWLAALERRYLADLRVPEVTRALRALSSAYVERRHKVSAGSTLDSAGKRAAFALFYGPLHFLAAAHAVRRLGADSPPPASILDVGCGTGAAGAAWALAAGTPTITGIDRHPWAVREARHTYRDLGLRGHASVADLSRAAVIGYKGVIAAYVLNELADQPRRRIEDQLVSAAHRGTRVLIVEPIANRITPWWNDAVTRLASAGARTDEWRVPVDLPPMLRMFDKAAGLDHRELTFKTIYLG
jgi:hypothetical protein